MKKKILAVLLIALSALCFYQVSCILYQYKEEKEIYDNISTLVKESEDDGQSIPKPREIDWEKLKKECPGIVAWIDVYGIDISYPVMQGKDNEFYLHHASTGETAACGSIFLNSTSRPDFSDQNSVVFGHYMKSRTMFGKLGWFAKWDAYEKSPYIRVYTPERNILYQIVSAYEVKVSDGVPGTYDIEKKEEKEYVAWFKKQLSLSEKEMKPCGTANMLTLSTCTGNGHSYRMIVQAAKIPYQQ